MNRLAFALALGLVSTAWGGVTYLDELPLGGMTCGLRLTPQLNRSVKGGVLRMGSATNRYPRGVGTHVESVFVLELDGHMTAFDAVVGIDWAANEYPKAWDTGMNWGGATFNIYGDGEVVASSGLIRPKDRPRKLHANLQGVRTVVLEATGCGAFAGYRFSHADWAEARFTGEDGALLRPHPNRDLVRQLGRLTPEDDGRPRINGPAVYGMRPGHEFICRLPVSGRRPLALIAAGLPPGIAFDAARGILTGRIANRGAHFVRFTATNELGKVEREIELRVGEEICLTPPLGWNSWNIHVKNVCDGDVRAAAKGMVESGLADHGWNYVNIDDAWSRKPSDGQPVRTADGTIIPNDRFPNMKALADFVHGFGLRFGIYSSPGVTTCGKYAASLGFEAKDAATWAEWGVDYLKYDWCSYSAEFARLTKGRRPTKEDYARPYRRMSECLRAQNRDIVHAFCQYGMGNVQDWGREAGGQVWRTHGDLKDSWGGVVQAVNSCSDSAWQQTGPGFWCDPDMLVVGYLGTGGQLHWSDLSPNEQYTHISLWCMLNAPLLLGCDLNRLDDFTLGLLVNDEVLAVHQDSLGRAAQRMVHRDREDVWVRMVGGNAHVVAVVNLFPFTRKIRVDFAELDLPSRVWVRDLWRQKDLGPHKGGIELEVPGHATTLLKVVGDPCNCD